GANTKAAYRSVQTQTRRRLSLHCPAAQTWEESRHDTGFAVVAHHPVRRVRVHRERADQHVAEVLARAGLSAVFNEGEVRAAIRAGTPAPGQYSIPWCGPGAMK